MTTYYVSSIIGSDDNAGTSGSAPLASLQAAEDLVKPGDTVEVMNGTYTGPGGGNVLTISTSGTASAPITFEAAPGATPVIDSSGTWQGIELDASYITIKGLTIVGDAANYNLSSAMAGYSTGNPDLDGNGIAATSGKLIHHIIIENNTIYNEPGGGIGINNGDYLQILNNNVHDNAHWSAYGASGISIGASQNFDNGPGPHIIITGNTSVNNAELVPEYRANAITDGEGIILDSNSGYTGGFLVQNNTTHGNSGPGIESFHSDNAVITGNTATGDLTNPNLVSEGEIFINQSNNNTVSNNITTAAAPPPPSGQLITNGSFETHDFGGWTLGGNSGASTWGPQIFIDTQPESGAYAAGLGSMGTDGTLSQTIATTAGKTYTLSFWLQNEAADANDFKATWNGQTLVSLTNAAQSGYKQYTYTVTATGATSTLVFSARNDPKQWDLDDVSLTANGTSSTPPTSGSGDSGGGDSGGGGGNLVANGSFETSGLSGWTPGGNSGASPWGPQIFIDTQPESGAHAAGMGSVGSDGTLSQTIATTAGKTYTLSFWLQNEADGANDFKATWNGQTLVSLTDAAQSGYKQYTYTVTATGATSTLVFSARNDPKHWDLDNVSLVEAPSGASLNSSPIVNSSASLAVNTPTVTTQTKADGSYDVVHSNVTGLSYSSYEDIFNSTGAQLAEARDMIGGAGTLLLNADDLLVSSSSGSLGVTTGSDTFKLNSHTSESIIASGREGETFEFGAGFGHESITGLLVGGASSDVIELPVTMFKGLSSTNTATQNWNALLSSGAAVQSGANVTITDPAQDVLTLNNVTTSMLSNHASEVFKFV